MDFEQIVANVDTRFPLYSESVKKQIVETMRWLSVETKANEVTDELKCNTAREIIKCCRDNPIPEIKIALLNLILGDFIKKPLDIDIPDVESALWLVRNLEYGYPNTPPTLPVEPIDFSKMFSNVKQVNLDDKPELS